MAGAGGTTHCVNGRKAASSSANIPSLLLAAAFGSKDTPCSSLIQFRACFLNKLAAQASRGEVWWMPLVLEKHPKNENGFKIGPPPSSLWMKLDQLASRVAVGKPALHARGVWRARHRAARQRLCTHARRGYATLSPLGGRRYQPRDICCLQDGGVIFKEEKVLGA